MEEFNNIHSKPCIAVVMSAYNERPEWLRKSIESILGQTWKNLRFYIALDNPDNMELKLILEEYAKTDSRIIALTNETNIGLVGSLNKLIDLTDEPYIARMDADDVSLPHRFEKEFKFLQDNHLDFVMSGADLLSEDGEIMPGRNLPNLASEDIAEIQKYANISIHPSWLVKKNVYKKLNGYRSIDHCEDLDFVLRALQQGCKLGRISEPLLQYRFRNTSISHANALVQNETAYTLQSLYKKGCDLESDTATNVLKQAGKKSSDKKRKKAANAKRNMNAFTQALYQRSWISCMRIALPSLIFNSVFRREFINSVRARAIINTMVSNSPN